MKKINVSVIIVHYKVPEHLFNCLETLNNLDKRVSTDVIVIDNDEKSTIQKLLMKRFPWVTYIKSRENKGYGAGNNIGAKKAKGEFLFFLNPDTKVFKETIFELLQFMKKNKNCGIVAPLLLDP